MMKSSSSRRSQGGFTLVELAVVLGLVAVLAIIGVPFARGLIIDGKVPTTATDLTRTATKLRSNFSNQGATPYAAINSATFANTARGLASALTVTGTGTSAAITHDLGTTGSVLVVAPSTITTAGDSFQVTFNGVNDAACPGLAGQVSKSAERITINGTAVKAVGGTYQGQTAGSACTSGDNNVFVFTFR